MLRRLRNWLKSDKGWARPGTLLVTGAVIVAGGTAMVVTTNTGGGGGGGGGAFTTADRWVDGAGACSATSGGVYVDASACADLDSAWDAVSNGGRVCIKAGTYNAQSVTGNKTSDTVITGNCGGAVTIRAVSVTDPCPSGTQGAAICSNATHAVFERFTVDGLNDHGYSTTMQVRGDDSEVRYVYFTASGTGSMSTWFVGQRQHVHHNEFEEDDSTPYQRSCNSGDAQPIQFEDGSDDVFEYNHIWQQGSDQTPCPPPAESANGFHLDVTRWQGTPSPTIRNNRFEEAEAGTGYVFCSGTNSCVNAKISGNYFTKNSDGSNWMQVRGDTIGVSCPMEMTQNTFYDGYAIIDGWCDPSTGGKWVGNAGTNQGCGGTVNTGNVWFGGGACSGNTILTGASVNAALGLGSDGRPTSSSSPVVNGGETAPGTYCNGATYTAGLDFDGHVRPFPGNAKCAAGAYEWGG